MKKILGLVVLSLFAISASAADLMASSAAPTVTQNIVVEGAACPGVGATGFSSTGLLLSCQSGAWKKQAGAFARAEFYSPGAITSSINISSITLWAAGAYRVCFSTPYPDTSYVAVVTNLIESGETSAGVHVSNLNKTTSCFDVIGGQTETNASVPRSFSVVVF
ncbi:hypothetical protein [Pseudomonas aeruginosa]|uniref:hypothetical protein n=1 Tax=Pseudomonas aeruginosa TaxID=287 RepID=UPI0022CE0991|nr:hypothetical protein [Pseudomonas aeruginosa]MBX6882468.1 hypothetical protein [Pseudomonas aeruginosa]MCZ9867273.1 hypothetical protein [Pseudomonas aeruginosa]